MKKILLFLLAAGALLPGAEIVVGPGTKYPTVNAGVKAMRPGDTLLIEPGEYFESVEVHKLGAPGVRTVIRARRPGTVLIRGDRPAPRFTQVSGTRFIYEAPWSMDASAVNERDSFKILTPASSRRELEFKRGLYFLDRKAKKLYISTSDGKRPDEHFYTVSVIRGSGLFVQDPVNVTIEGIAVTGFFSLERLRWRIASSCYGIRINRPRNSTIRNCLAFFNANGIHTGHGDGGTIENCVAFANGSLNPPSGGNILGWGPAKNTVIRNCVSFYCTQPEGQVGIRIYQGPVTGCRIENCISFGQQPITTKCGTTGAFCFNNFCREGFNMYEGSHNTSLGLNGYRRDDKGLLRADKIGRGKHDALFADPDNLDYRPQGGVSGIEAGLVDKKDVFFVSGSGNDKNDGRSVRRPWKTFKNVRPDTTVYLLPGDYPGFTLAVPGVTLRTRGAGRKAVFRGDVTVTAPRVTLRDLNFLAGNVAVKGEGATLRCCGFQGILSIAASGCTVVHNAFLKKPEPAPDTVAHSNLLPGMTPAPEYADIEAGDFTVRNASAFTGRGWDGLAVGPYRLYRRAERAKIFGPFVRSMTPTTVNIEWWTDRSDVSSELRWGGDPSCGNRLGVSSAGGSYHTATLSGLTPGEKYHFLVASRSPLREHHDNAELALLDEFKPRELVKSAPVTFTLPLAARPPREFFVSPEGSDDAAGTRGAPFASISKGVESAAAGDTVTVGDGVYRESVVFRSGGDKTAPITLRAAHAGRAVIDGGNIMPVALTLENQSHIVIDGLTFRNIKGSDRGCIVVRGGEHVTIRRCFSDGRALSYTPGLIEAFETKALTIENCVILRGFKGANFWRCPGLVIRNCVWHGNQICHFYVHNDPAQKVLLEKNIFSENCPQKYIVPLISFWHLESVTLKDNLFSLRMPQENRAVIGYSRLKGDRVSRQTNLATFVREGGRVSGSIFRDPQWPVLPDGLLKFKKSPLLGGPRVPEHVELDRQVGKELGLTPKGYTPWHISQFISQDRELLQKHIGLEREQFR